MAHVRGLVPRAVGARAADPGLPVRADVSVYVTLDRSTDPREYGDRAEIARLSPTPRSPPRG